MPKKAEYPFESEFLTPQAVERVNKSLREKIYEKFLSDLGLDYLTPQYQKAVLERHIKGLRELVERRIPKGETIDPLELFLRKSNREHQSPALEELPQVLNDNQ